MARMDRQQKCKRPSLVQGAGVSVSTAGQVTFMSSNIYGNTAYRADDQTGYGGGIHAIAIMRITDQTKIYDNWATSEGGGIKLYGAKLPATLEFVIGGNTGANCLGFEINSESGSGRMYLYFEHGRKLY